jgi:hypothetical protein
MRAIANLHARVRQQESTILGAAKPASSLSLSLALSLSLYVSEFPVPVSLQGGEASAGWTLEGCKMNDIHWTEENRHGRQRNRYICLIAV